MVWDVWGNEAVQRMRLNTRPAPTSLDDVSGFHAMLANTSRRLSRLSLDETIKSQERSAVIEADDEDADATKHYGFILRLETCEFSRGTSQGSKGVHQQEE